QRSPQKGTPQQCGQEKTGQAIGRRRAERDQEMQAESKQSGCRSSAARRLESEQTACDVAEDAGGPCPGGNSEIDDGVEAFQNAREETAPQHSSQGQFVCRPGSGSRYDRAQDRAPLRKQLDTKV